MMFGTNCSFRCWECNNSCEIKNTFFVSDALFFSNLSSAFKASVGFSITAGMPVKKAEEENIIPILCLITARQKCLETKK